MDIESLFEPAPWNLRMPRIGVDGAAVNASEEDSGLVKPVVVAVERPAVYRRVEDYDPVLRSHCRL